MAIITTMINKKRAIEHAIVLALSNPAELVTRSDVLMQKAVTQYGMLQCFRLHARGVVFCQIRGSSKSE
jgi:hypothetical protein